MTVVITREVIGTLIDAVYAIAFTILALEFPGGIDHTYTTAELLESLIQYVVSFFILFALWMQHRRIAHLSEPENPLVLWVHASVLLLVCLIPRATAMVFHDGGNVTLGDLFEGWQFEELIDVFYILLVGAADLGLIVLLFLGGWSQRHTRVWRDTLRSKIIVTCSTAGLFGLSFLVHEPNRVFLLMMPAALMMEGIIIRMWLRRTGELVNTE